MGKQETNALAPIHKARKLLATMESPREVKEYGDKAQAVADYLLRTGAGVDAANEAMKHVVWAQYRLGEMLAGIEKAKGGQPYQQATSDTPSPVETLSDLGVTTKQSSRAQQLFLAGEGPIEACIAEVIAAHADALTLALLRKLGRKPKPYEPERPESPPEIWHAPQEEWIKTQPDCDLLLTDPPYMTDVEDVGAFVDGWLHDWLAKVKPTGRAYVCIGAYPDELWAYLSIEPPKHLSLTNILVWTYRNTLGQMPSHDYKLNWQAVLHYRGKDAPPLTVAKTVDQFAVFDINAPDGRLGDRCHTWQKPDKLANIIVQQATKKGDVVLDPFCCTGTFILAANRFGRIGRGCDVDAANLALAEKRGCVYG